MIKVTQREKSLFYLTVVVHHPGKSQQGTWRQKLKQNLWRSAVHWLSPHGLLSLLS